MNSPRTNPGTLLLITGGATTGALGWFAASLASGTFEPYDSGTSLLVNQGILTAPAVLLAWRYRLAVPFLFMAGAYLGMNAYAYAFGGPETKAWAALGAVVSTLLFLLPMALTLGTAALRHLLRGPQHPEDGRPRAKQD